MKCGGENERIFAAGLDGNAKEVTVGPVTPSWLVISPEQSRGTAATLKDALNG